MDRITFLKEYKLSRGQLDRKLAKAGTTGFFELAGYGNFKATKTGKSKTAPLDIVPIAANTEASLNEPAEQSSDAPVIANAGSIAGKKYRRKTHSELSRMTIQELDKEKRIAEIQKLEQQADEGRKLIREEAINELIPTFIGMLSNLRDNLTELNMDEDKIKNLSSIINKIISEAETYA